MEFPMICKSVEGTPAQINLASYHLTQRTVFFSGQVDSASADLIVQELLYLYGKSREPIVMYINSPGGSVTDGMAIFDTMRYVKPKIRTVCLGMAASMGAFLLASGTKGKRFALPNSEIMIHQPLIGGNGLSGQATDIKIHTDHLVRTRNKLNEILAKNTGKSIEEIARDTERDNFMYAEQAKEYGLIDEVMVHR